MLKFALPGLRRILALGAHSDDIEIGVGGTLLSLIEANPELEIYWVVFSASRMRYGEALDSAGEYLAPLKDPQIEIKSYRESYFPVQWEEIKGYLEEIKKEFEPDLVFTHYREDRHQDHRVLSDLAWNTFRHHLILEYEIPKYDGDLGHPNFFFSLAERIASRKIELLLKHFKSQATSKHWFSSDSFSALARIRGIESASPLAEAFYARKITFSPPLAK
jgi:LmbE family N-acetylglucosaminyl deacetylase